MNRQYVLPRLLGIALTFLAGAAGPASGDDPIRVRVFAGAPISSLTLTVPAPVTVYEAGTDYVLAHLPAGVPVTIEDRGATLRFLWSGSGALTGPARLVADEPALFRLDPSGRSPARSYRGTISIYPRDAGDGRLTIVNTIDLESYVAAVLPSEYPFQEIEGVKAQAVVIRTYAVGTGRKYGGLYDVVDNEASQVYRGAGAETPVSREAVRATTGEILTYEGLPIDAVYSSQCGGHSADNESVWDGLPEPYLRGKPDPFERDTPDETWSIRLDRKKLLDALSRRYNTRARGIRVERTTPDGRVHSIRIEGSPQRTIRGSAFRTVVNQTFGERTLKSTYFKIDRKRRHYVVDGRGFGHGVGLCQYGAQARAAAGQSYGEILAFYYTDVALERAADALPLAEARLPEELPPSAPEAGVDTPSPTSSPSRSERPRRRRVQSIGGSVQAIGTEERTSRLRPDRRVGW